MTPVQILRERHPEMSEAEVRSHLGSFGVGRLAVQLVGSLSGGMREKKTAKIDGFLRRTVLGSSRRPCYRHVNCLLIVC